MSTYKLTYFNLTGLGEPIRFLLSYAGVAFEDNRVSHADWPQLKSKTPLEQLPILEVDGKTLYQSNPIVRFLAKRFNLNGTDEFEAFQVDAVLETISDLKLPIIKFAFSDSAQKAALKEETQKKVTFYLDKLEAAVKENGGYFVGGKLSAADISLAGLEPIFTQIWSSDMFENYPNLKNLVDKVVAQPGIKSYIAKRPKTDA